MTISFNKIPVENFINSLTYLDDKDIARAQGVCKTWNNVINSDDNFVWEERCKMHAIPKNPGFTSKQLACMPKGKVKLSDFSSLIIFPKFRDTAIQPRWGSDATEPFVKVDLSKRVLKRLGNYFPQFLPLRLFVHPDGNYKKRGDRLFLVFEKVPFSVTCSGKHFSEKLARKADSSIRELTLSPDDLSETIEAGKAQKGSWASSD